MKEHTLDHKSPQKLERLHASNYAKTAWPGQALNCEQCLYNDQDIDACPCAKCHTRN